MSAESIGSLVSTKIPGYADAADIQATLRLYHYGSYDYDPANTSTAQLVNPSIAYSINSLQTQIDSIGTDNIQEDFFTAKGQLISASAPATPLILAPGTNNQILVANSATSTGLQWTNSIVSATLTSPIIEGLGIIFEGSSIDNNETTLGVVNPTADRTINLPDESGTIALKDMAVINSSLTSYSLVVSENTKLINLTSSSSITVTVPANTSQAFPIGSQINIVQAGTGQVTLVPASGVTINSVSTSLKTRIRWSAVQLIKTDTNTWILVGDLDS